MKFTPNYSDENTKNHRSLQVVKNIGLGMLVILLILFYALSFDFLLS